MTFQPFLPTFSLTTALAAVGSLIIWLEVYSCTFGLCHLLISWYDIQSAVLLKMCASLLEVERDTGLDTLFTDVEYPVIVTDTGLASRLAADSHLLASLGIPAHRGSGISQRGKHSMKIYRAKQRLTYNLLMPYGQLKEDGQTLICATLVLHGAADGHILIAFAPVLWQTLSDTLRSLRNHVEMEVTTSFDHQPRIFTPFISFLDEEI